MSTDDKAASNDDAKTVLSEDELDKVSGGHNAIAGTHQDGMHQSGTHQSGKVAGTHASALKQ